MPLLDPGNLPVLPVGKTMTIIAEQLTGAQGIYDDLNASVAIGVDAVLNDAINGNPLESMCPAVRLVFPLEGLMVASNTGGGVWYRITLQLYFVYYFGVPSTGVIPTAFTDLRDRHIAWNMEYLQNAGIKPNTTIGLTRSQFLDDAGKQFWMFPGDAVMWTVDHDTPFRYLSETVQINPSTGYSCSRVDIPIQVLKHATFNA